MGILLVGIAFVLGLFGCIYVGIIGGALQIGAAFSATPVNGLEIAYGVIRIIFCETIGLAFGIIPFLIGASLMQADGGL